HCQRTTSMRLKLTDKIAGTARPGLYWDTDRNAPPGFLLQVTTAGSRSYRLNYRRKSDDRERRLTIGDVATWSLDAAAKRAAELRQKIDRGFDPLGERQKQREAPTVADLWARFVEEALPSREPRTRAEYKAEYRDWIEPALGKLKVATVSREDIEKLHRAIT